MSTIEERRLLFHDRLRILLPNDISLYFCAPSNLILNYPAALYKRDGMDRKSADNKVYLKRCKYTVTIIDDTPTESYIDLILEAFEYASFDRQYVYDNLYHYVFTIYF